MGTVFVDDADDDDDDDDEEEEEAVTGAAGAFGAASACITSSVLIVFSMCMPASLMISNSIYSRRWGLSESRIRLSGKNA